MLKSHLGEADATAKVSTKAASILLGTESKRDQNEMDVDFKNEFGNVALHRAGQAACSDFASSYYL
jgi:hypothetical protein